VIINQDIQEKRRIIENIYRKHGFVIREWTGLLRCTIGEACELHDESDVAVQAKMEAAWKEIDRVIHGIVD
jgi:hypothetical protein